MNSIQARRIISLLLIAAGLVLFTTGLRSYYYRNVLLPRHTQELSAQLIPAASQPTHIEINDLINIDIQPAWIDEKGAPTIAQKSANFLITSAQPRENNNVIIYGHNTKDVFGKLLQIGDQDVITLTLQSGEQRWYKVQSKQRVTTAQTEPLYPTTSETLTLYTCDGWADQDRFVVQAVPI